MYILSSFSAQTLHIHSTFVLVSEKCELTQENISADLKHASFLVQEIET